MVRCRLAARVEWQRPAQDYWFRRRYDSEDSGLAAACWRSPALGVLALRLRSAGCSEPRADFAGLDGEEKEGMRVGRLD